MNQDLPLNYIERIREYYQVLGYGEPYQWAHFDDVPFTPLEKPLAQSTIGIVTTAAPYRADAGDQGPGAAYNGLAKFFSVYSDVTATEPELCISHVGYDRSHSTAQDQGSYFPLKALKALSAAGKIEKIAPRFHGLPTNRSQKTTLEVDCAELVSRCREDAIDAAILVPNCPVCHQSVSLAARALEAAGIATVIMGCARDIVEHALSLERRGQLAARLFQRGSVEPAGNRQQARGVRPRKTGGEKSSCRCKQRGHRSLRWLRQVIIWQVEIGILFPWIDLPVQGKRFYA